MRWVIRSNGLPQWWTVRLLRGPPVAALRRTARGGAAGHHSIRQSCSRSFAAAGALLLLGPRFQRNATGLGSRPRTGSRSSGSRVSDSTARCLMRRQCGCFRERLGEGEGERQIVRRLRCRADRPGLPSPGAGRSSTHPRAGAQAAPHRSREGGRSRKAACLSMACPKR